MSKQFYGSNRMQEQLYRIKATMNGLKTEINEELDEEYAPITTAELNADFEEVFGQGGSIGTKTITENGVYESSSDGFVGYSEIMVNVAGSGGSDYSLLPNSDRSKVAYSFNAQNLDMLLADFSFNDENNTDVTMYGVVKSLNTNTGDYGILGSMYDYSAGNCPCFFRKYGTQLWTSVYDSGDKNTDYSANDKHVIAMSLNQTTKKVKYYIDGVELTAHEKTFNNSSYSSFVGYGQPGKNPQEIDFMGAVTEVESSETIIANMQHLMEVFEIS